MALDLESTQMVRKLSKGICAIGAIAARIRNRHGKGSPRLTDLSDDQLKDIGVIRAELREHASRSWFWDVS